MGSDFSAKKFTHPVAQAYFDKVAAAGGNVSDKNTIERFVTGMARIADPSQWVCWPLRSQHNFGTGTTVYFLGGYRGSVNATFNGTAAWSSSGLVTNGDNVGLVVPTGYFPLPASSFFALSYNKSSNVNISLYTGVGLTSRGLAHQISTLASINILTSTVPYWKTHENTSFGGGMKRTVSYNIPSSTVPAAANIYGDGALLSFINGTGDWNAATTNTYLIRQISTSSTEGYTVPYIITGSADLNALQHQAIYNLVRETLAGGLNY